MQNIPAAGRLAEALRSRRPLILDGAMGTELVRRGITAELPLWSAAALLHHPAKVLEIHRDYIEAGAGIITANTFRTTARTFRRAHVPDRSGELTPLAVRLAEEAVAAFPDRDVLIAGSIAPLEDCYRPDLTPADAELREEHAELALRLAGAGADFLLVETMNTVREATAAAAAASATGLEFVVSFLCGTDGSLTSGESLRDAAGAVLPLGPAALSVNCVSPRFLDAPLAILRSATDLPLGVYGNVGVPGGTGEFVCDVGPEEYARFALHWAEMGAAIIGGCCGTTPDYIRMLCTALRQA